MSVSRIKILRNLSKKYNSCNILFAVDSRQQIQNFGPLQQSAQSNHSRKLSTPSNNVLIKEPLLPFISVSRYAYTTSAKESIVLHIHSVTEKDTTWCGMFLLLLLVAGVYGYENKCLCVCACGDVCLRSRVSTFYHLLWISD